MTPAARALVIAAGVHVLASGCAPRPPVREPVAPAGTTGQPGTGSPALAVEPGSAPGSGAAIAATPGGPYLVIEHAAIAPTGVCQPGQPVLEVTARIANRGTAASVAVIGLGMVNAQDPSRGWGNGEGVPALQPGQRVTVTFPIYYLVSEPRYMPGRHTFQVRLNAGNWFPADVAQPDPVPVDVTLPGTCPGTTPAIAQ
ncbi:MAG TPA: hypothetical protein VNM90_26020 [Haliangium sp.]|nr:hypothetical protein [Haliangium sp.]